MFWYRDDPDATTGEGRVGVAFTDATLDLQGMRPGFAAAHDVLAAELGVSGFARANQVHGRDVLVVDQVGPGPGRPPAEFPDADGLVTTTPGVCLMVRAADCVPVVLADAEAGVVGVAHAGRVGMMLGVVEQAVAVMADQGARRVRAWVGPHVCGRCYEVPAAMREEVEALRPGTAATTRTGTPAVDVGAGVVAQLRAAGVEVVDVGGCTVEEPRLHSYRRDGAASGRLGALVWLR